MSWILYFVSRPTAVNLSDAATKLKEVVSKAAATSSEAMAVFQVLIFYCYNLRICNLLFFDLIKLVYVLLGHRRGIFLKYWHIMDLSFTPQIGILKELGFNGMAV